METTYRTALEVFLDPYPEHKCPHFQGWLELFEDPPLEVGICETQPHRWNYIGKTWARKVCILNGRCPYKHKLGNNSVNRRMNAMPCSHPPVTFPEFTKFRPRRGAP